MWSMVIDHSYIKRYLVTVVVRGIWIIITWVDKVGSVMVESKEISRSFQLLFFFLSKLRQSFVRKIIIFCTVANLKK